jgi:hypothetical protein
MPCGDNINPLKDFFNFDFLPLFDGDGPPPFTTFLGLLVANVFVFSKEVFQD